MPHIHDLYDFTVGAFIVFDNKVLLVEHPRYGMWIQPGGHVELHENPEQALYREIAEETGLKVTVLSSKPDIKSPGHEFLLTPNYLQVHDANPPHRHIDLKYFCKADSPDYVLSAEHTAMRWFSETDLEDPRYKLDPDVIFCSKQAIAAAKQQ